MMNRRSFLQTSTWALSTMAIAPRVLGSTTSTGDWSRLADIPYPVQEIYPALFADHIHVAGGFTVQGSAVVATDRHVRYSIGADRWEARAPLPAARHHPHLVANGEALYALGGFHADAAGDWVMQGQTWRYDGEKDRWEAVADAPEPHAETVCLAAGADIHVIGGRTPRGSSNAGWQDHGDSARHLVFDTASRQWRRAAPAPSARNSAAGAVIGGDLYVVGGRTVTGGNVADLDVYDMREDRWRQAAPLPQAQGGLAAAALANRLIAFGGEFFGAEGFGVHGNTWCYDPDSDRWEPLTPMLTPRHGLGAVSDGRRVFAMGGATGVATTGTSPILEALSLG